MKFYVGCVAIRIDDRTLVLLLLLGVFIAAVVGLLSLLVMGFPRIELSL